MFIIFVLFLLFLFRICIIVQLLQLNGICIFCWIYFVFVWYLYPSSFATCTRECRSPLKGSTPRSVSSPSTLLSSRCRSFVPPLDARVTIVCHSLAPTHSCMRKPLFFELLPLLPRLSRNIYQKSNRQKIETPASSAPCDHCVCHCHCFCPKHSPNHSCIKLKKKKIQQLV